MSSHSEDLEREIDEFEKPPTPAWISSKEMGRVDDHSGVNRAGVVEGEGPHVQKVPIVEDPNEPM